MRTVLLVLFGSACATEFLAAQPGARHLPPPRTYSVTEVMSLMLSPEGTGSTLMTAKIARDGRWASVERSFEPQPGMPKGQHMRTLYDFQTHRDYTWDLSDSTSSNPCALTTFSGDWGDPFAGPAEMTADVLKRHPRVVGRETLNGIATTVLQVADPAGHGDMKVWLDDRYGLLVRLDRPAADGREKTVLEIRELSLAKPSAALLAPPECPSEPSAPAPTEAERLAAATGGTPGDFVDARLPPVSRQPCTALVRIVRAGTLEPITSGFQLAIDTQVEPEHPAHYVVGAGMPGRATFSGGGLREVTGEFRDGLLRVPTLPPQFDVEADFGNGGSGSWLIYRQCFRPQTVLLLVVTDPAHLSAGASWWWIKAGRLATVSGPTGRR